MGVLETTTDFIPLSLSRDLASLAGLPSSACASSPLPQSFFPAVKIGALSMCTTASPGENANDHFTPLEAVNASAFVMFPIRTENLIGWLPLAEASLMAPAYRNGIPVG